MYKKKIAFFDRDGVFFFVHLYFELFSNECCCVVVKVCVDSSDDFVADHDFHELGEWYSCFFWEFFCSDHIGHSDLCLFLQIGRDCCCFFGDRACWCCSCSDSSCGSSECRPSSYFSSIVLLLSCSSYQLFFYLSFASSLLCFFLSNSLS